MAARSATVGVDLGTHAVRVAVVADDGEVLALESVAIHSSRVGDRHEQEPEEWWSASCLAIGTAVGRAGALAVAAVSISGTSGSVLLLEDADGDPARPLTPGLMYDDRRAADTARRLLAGPRAPAWDAAGFTPVASSGLAKLAWLAETGAVSSGARLGHHVDLITARLCGAPVASDLSHAMKSGADLLAADWPREILAGLGIPVEVLPALVVSGSRIGEVSALGALATGLPEGTPVIAGMTDGCAGQIAAGVLDPGSWAAVLGTTSVLKGVVPEPLVDPSHAIYHHRAPDGTWWAGGASSAGSGVLEAAFGASLDALRAAVDVRQPATAVAYPLAGTGERFPFHAEGAAQVFSSPPEGSADRYAALVQGVAFHLRLMLDSVAAAGAAIEGPLALAGGVARSAAVVQLIADICARPVRIPGTPEGAVGMAVLAASERTGLRETARRMLPDGVIVDPAPEGTPEFDLAYGTFRGMIEREGWLDAPSGAR